MFLCLSFICYSMMLRKSILKVSFPLPRMVPLFTLPLRQNCLSSMHLPPSCLVTCFLRDLAFYSTALIPCFFFLDDLHHILCILFSTSLHYFRQMFSTKFGVQASLTAHPPPSFLAISDVTEEINW